MMRHRNPLLTLLMLACLALLPASAWAGSLLSGYGAPGGGAQAIVGSALVNGGGGGTSSGGGANSSTLKGTGATTGATSSQGVAPGKGGSATHGTAEGAGGAHATHGGRAHAGAPTLVGGAGTGASVSSAPAYTYPGSSRMAGAGNSSALGFTGTDLLLLALVLGVLALTASLTKRLARTPH